MALEKELKVVYKPISPGLYRWRYSKNCDWEIVRVSADIGDGWGLCAHRHSKYIPIDNFGGIWGDEIVPPAK